MRVLLDECVPRALREELSGHETKTLAEAGWAGVKNGLLPGLANRRQAKLEGAGEVRPLPHTEVAP